MPFAIITLIQLSDLNTAKNETYDQWIGTQLENPSYYFHR